MVISKQVALLKIKNAGSSIFGVEFTKADGTLRKMGCRLHCSTKAIEANQTGRRNAPNKDAYKVKVYDMGVETENGQGAFRTIPVDSLHVLRIGGEVFDVS